jgi:hypothetical protein
MPPQKTKKRRYVQCRCTVFGCHRGPGGSTRVTYHTERGHAKRQKFEDIERAAARVTAPQQPAPAPAPTPAPGTMTTTTITTTAVVSSAPTQALSIASPAPSTSTAIEPKEDSNVGK